MSIRHLSVFSRPVSTEVSPSRNGAIIPKGASYIIPKGISFCHIETDIIFDFPIKGLVQWTCFRSPQRSLLRGVCVIRQRKCQIAGTRPAGCWIIRLAGFLVSMKNPKTSFRVESHNGRLYLHGQNTARFSSRGTPYTVNGLPLFSVIAIHLRRHPNGEGLSV